MESGEYFLSKKEKEQKELQTKKVTYYLFRKSNKRTLSRGNRNANKTLFLYQIPSRRNQRRRKKRVALISSPSRRRRRKETLLNSLKNTYPRRKINRNSFMLSVMTGAIGSQWPLDPVAWL
jgi:branched-subunit amino acid aminotransferase/4-amino-4-deoxychorismate lyase